MRLSVLLGTALFILSSNLCIANEYGDLIYDVNSENGIIKLKITNKKHIPTKLKSIILSLPTNNEEGQEEKEKRQIEIPIDQNAKSTENIIVELGEESELAKKILKTTYPDQEISQFKRFNISENPSQCPRYKPSGYQSCKSIGFGVYSQAEYEDKTLSNNLVTFMQYIK
ncbi:MAG: hypothetical protein ACXVB0_24820 [Mucilaginibacter sp.]